MLQRVYFRNKARPWAAQPQIADVRAYTSRMMVTVGGEKARWLHARLLRSLVMEAIRGIVVPRRRSVAAAWLMVDGMRVNSKGNSSIDTDLSDERCVICSLELDVLRSLTTFAERLAGCCGVAADLDVFRIGPQPEGCSPLVLRVDVPMLRCSRCKRKDTSIYVHMCVSPTRRRSAHASWMSHTGFSLSSLF